MTLKNCVPDCTEEELVRLLQRIMGTDESNEKTQTESGVANFRNVPQPDIGLRARVNAPRHVGHHKEERTMTKKAVIVFSGGQDSTTCLIHALPHYDEIHCITFDYGQRHRAEIEVAQRLAKELGVTAHKVLDTTLLNELAISSLTRDNIPVPTASSSGNGLPSTFVPGRNILFLTLASIYAYQVQAETVITGVCETDFSGYPDCRDEFVKALHNAIELGMDYKLRIETPLMWLNKAETWALAEYHGKLELIQHQTLTCYNGIKGSGCGVCDACNLRAKGLNEFLENKSVVMEGLKDKLKLK